MSWSTALVYLCLGQLLICSMSKSVPRRALLQPGHETQGNSKSAGVFVAHQVGSASPSKTKSVVELGNCYQPFALSVLAFQCLWSSADAFAAASAFATSTGATAFAFASASASATGAASTRRLKGAAGTCSLNPSYFFSLSAAGKGPAQDSEK
jgi:hypothetical protein